jgi:putative intracellular protease/amidase
VILYILAFLIVPAGAGTFGFLSSMDTLMGQSAQPAPPANLALPTTPAAYDPTKPIVVVLLGDDVTEATDFLGPYNLFSAAKAFNVYALAPQHRLTILSSGLDVYPDMSLAEFDQRFGRNPDLIVVPQIPLIKEANNQPILSWIKNHAGPQTQLLSWCVGAGVLAATGLLDGKSATTHWGDIDQLEKDYPQVHWVRGVRYVDEGNNIVTSAGLTSGIDASLHVLAKLKGSAFAKALADSLHYPSYDFVDTPQVPQYKIDLSASIYLFNAGYQWEKRQYGVLLYDGMNELDLAAVMDTYSGSFIANLMTVAPTRQLITTQYGLHLLPRWDLGNAPKLERLLISGTSAHQLVPASITDWAKNKSVPTAYLQAAAPDRFAYDAPLEDLARQENNPTAEFGKMRLEYRANTTNFEGSGWPLLLMIRPLLLGLLGLGAAFLIERLWNMRRKRQQQRNIILSSAAA